MKLKWISLAALIPVIVLITAAQAWSTLISFEISDGYVKTDENFSVNMYTQKDATSKDLQTFGFDMEGSPLLTCKGYDIASHAAQAAVPESGSILLFGLSLIGVSGMLRKNQKRLNNSKCAVGKLPPTAHPVICFFTNLIIVPHHPTSEQ